MITAAQLRAARALPGIDQKDLAAAAKLPLPTIQRMEASDGVIRGTIGTKEAKEVVVVNAHARYSAYNMMAGVLSPMAQDECISRDPREPRTRNTAPW